MTGSTTAPCDSNDSRNDYASSFEPCANEPPQSFFSCDAADAEDLIDAESASPIVLEFDYEIHTPLELGDDISSAIEDFQGSLVAGVADFYGIKECSQRKLRRVESDSRKLGKYSDVTVDEGALGGNAPVVGCASTPSDEPDDKISLCVNEVAISEESNCTPMKGYLTIYTQTSQRRRLNSEEAEEEALVAIQQYIRSSTEYLSSDVLAVSYIGTRDVIPVGILNPDLLLRPGFGNRNLDAPSPGETSLAPLVKREAVAGASLSGLAVVLFAAVQYFKRRHKSSSGIMKRQNSLVSAQHNQAIEVV